MNNNKS